MKTLAIFLCIILALASAQQKPDLVIEMCRHGARNALSNQYDNYFDPTYYGDLTPAGMRQHYLLGSSLVKEYPNILGVPYNKSFVYAVSDDDCDRCVQSALSQFYAIYLGQGPGLGKDYPTYRAVPLYNSTWINKTIATMDNSQALQYGHTAINIPVVDGSNTLIFNSDDSAFCPNNALWRSQNLNDAKSLAAWTLFGPTINNLNKYGNISTPLDLMLFGDTYFCDLYLNKSLPGGMPYNADLQLNLTYAFSYFMAHYWEGQKIQRETTGWGMIQGIINYTNNFAKGHTKTNFVLYSGHDDNLHAVLSALGIVTDDCILANFQSWWSLKKILYPNCHFPYFASTIKVELYNTSSPYVKFYYENELIPLCNNQPQCSLADFTKLLQNAIGNRNYAQWAQACGATTSEKAENVNIEAGYQVQGNSNWTVEKTAILIMAIFCVLLVGKLAVDNKKHREEIHRISQEKLL